MKKFKLNIEARKEGEWSNFSVLDGNKNIVAQETGSFSLDLPKGLYSILEESGNTIKKEIVVLNDNITYSSKKFTEKSSVKKKKSRKKYLNDAYERGKKISERELSDTSALSPLLLFMYVDSDDFKKSWFSIKDQIAIVDRDLNSLKLNDDAKWEVDKEEGWLSFNHKLSPGQYYLIFKGQRSRSIPFELFKENQTQISISFNEEPNYDDFQINLFPLNNHGQDRKGDKSFKIALNKLNNKDYTLSENILKELAYGKWKNPMYGLVVAYIYLKSNSHNYDDLFNNVIENLERKILFTNESSDIKLIKILNKLHNNENVDSDDIPNLLLHFETPPILRVGMETLVELSFEYPDIIKRDSIVDLISDRIYYDIPWTSFKPLEENDDYFNFPKRSIKPQEKKIDFTEFSDESPDDFDKVKFIDFDVSTRPTTC